MRIDFHYGAHSVPESERATRQNSTTVSGAVNVPPSGEDQAQLSGAQAQVTALAAQVSQLPEIRQERVQALRLAVESGNYHADAGKVAAAVVEQMTFGTSA